MEPFNKKIEPKIIPNLENKVRTGEETGKPMQLDKHNSASFKETKIKYQNQISPVPHLNKNGNNIQMPQMEYTKEERWIRPVADKDKRLNIEGKQRESLSFSKAMVGSVAPMKQPIHYSLTNNGEEIESCQKEIEIPPLKKKRKFSLFFLLAILIELIIIGILLYYKNEKTKTTLECTNQTYSEYYHANIINTKKYFFQKGKITKLEDIFTYTFDTEDYYKNFKQSTANLEKQAVEGRKFMTTMDDNKKEYVEKTIYDFHKLRKQNETDMEHTILIHTKEEADTIQLLDYNSTDIQFIYASDYICK